MKKYFLLISAVFILAGCSPKKTPVRMTDFALGTVVSATLYDADKRELFPELFDLIRGYENRISRNIEGSCIYSLNLNAGKQSVKVSEDVFDILTLSEKYAELSSGRFDITVGPLIDLWGIGTENAKVPPADEIKKALSLIDWRKLVLDREGLTAFLPAAGMAVDLGGIAKGFIADRAGDFLKEKGVSGGIVDLGGNILVFGRKPDDSDFNIGIQDPFDVRGKYIGIVNISSGSVVTSGVYERFLEKEGKRYHHIFDISTGYPVDNEIAGVSVVSRFSADGDALSTSVFALGLERGMELIEKTEGSEAIFISKSKEVYVSSGLKNNFRITDEDFVAAYLPVSE